MRAALRAVGELSITAGLILMFFGVYLLWGTGSYTQGRQVLLQRELAADQAEQDRGRIEKIKLGKALALLRIPRLGRDYRYAVVEGVDAEHLKKGPGHYPDTAMPGQIGNFVISGHRTTYAAPFNEIDRLDRDDEIIVEAREARYTYRVTSKDVVEPDEMDVLAPVPGRPGTRPIRAVITLTTATLPAAAVGAVLWYVVFPLLEPAVTLDEVTVRR
jgi:sortase A